MTERIPSARGAAPSIVESFRIEGLYGYRTISLSSEYAATILIAKNGSGKTTLLAALDAFLKAQFLRLIDVKFDRICCKLRGIDRELVLSREDVLSYTTLKPDSELFTEARRMDIEPLRLFKYIVEERGDNDDPRFDEIFSAIVRRFNYSRPDAQVFCDRLKDSLADGIPAIRSIVEALKIALRGTEVVYLPTYRRIELPLEATKEKGSRRSAPFRVTQSGLYPGDIQFGLSDISERLSQLNQSILFDSNQGYRQISASMINELIDGTFGAIGEAQEIPDQDELEIFFSRLKDGRRVSPYIDVTVPNIDKIYTGAVPGETNKFLRYFLSKLNTVLKATRDTETLVKNFIDSCNSYLSSIEPSTWLDNEVASISDGSDKILRLNRKDLKVHVETPAGRRILLDALSSGEKQMISLFAKLFLYPKDKIILIDEPELSLSIDWQRRILEDVMNAPLCKQVVAITHSPFIFDNSLEPYARSLISSIDTRDDSSLDAEEDLHE